MTMDIARLHYQDEGFDAKICALRKPPTAAPDTAARVADIINRVREGGYAALCDITAELDGAVNGEVCIKINDKTRAGIMAKADPGLLAALQTAAARLREYHRRQLPQGWEKDGEKDGEKESPKECYQEWQFADDDGNILGERASPVYRAMIYAPGGKAAYPSSVLMGAIPAKMAGVKDICIATPARGGEINPAVLLAAVVAGADSVWKFGGAQAVAAFALGCPPVIPRADVIVGPGNVYVSEAKRQLFGAIALDSIAGPSEVVILFDKSANPQWVAADLLAQAEHDEDAMCIGITDCDCGAVMDALAAQLKTMARADIAARALAKGGMLITARDINQCCEITNAFAPEHLQVMCEDAENITAGITTAAAVFVGMQTPVAFGDYCAGTNHVLPTGGAARFFSPLSARHFIRRTSTFRASKEGAAKLATTTATIAKAEGFYGHANSALLRCGGEQ